MAALRHSAREPWLVLAVPSRPRLLAPPPPQGLLQYRASTCALLGPCPLPGLYSSYSPESEVRTASQQVGGAVTGKSPEEHEWVVASMANSEPLTLESCRGRLEQGALLGQASGALAQPQ